MTAVVQLDRFGPLLFKNEALFCARATKRGMSDASAKVQSFLEWVCFTRREATLIRALTWDI